jgi:hypothetical protein
VTEQEVVMWEHGMPGSAWDMAVDLSRWEELRAEDELNGGGQTDANADDEAAIVGETQNPRRRPWSAWPGRRERQRVWRWQRRAGIAAVAVLALASVTWAGVAQASGSGRGGIVAVRTSVAAGNPVVVLGDSYAAGNLVPASPVGSPVGCLRSSHDYAADVAAALKARTFVNAACSGATSGSMTRPQVTLIGTNAPQFSSLASDDAVVMVTLGGDDFGGFSHVMETCALLSFTNPFGAPCARHYGDSLAKAISADAPKIAAVLNGIRARAPQARILEVGYPDIFPNSGAGCWPFVPIAHGDVAFLRGLEKSLNQMLATQTAATGTTYVDTYTPTIGHDFCQSEDVRYVEGLVPGSIAEPFHPNARGYRALAAVILRALG